MSATVFIPVAAAGLLVAILIKAGQAKPGETAQQQGRIRPGLVSAWLTVAGGAGFIAFGFFNIVTVQTNDRWTGLVLVALGMFVGGYMLPSLHRSHQLSWTPEGVVGPNRTLGPSLGFTTDTIPWSQIRNVGTTLTQYWFIEAIDGRRIYWSYLYPRYGRFVLALKAQRPDLALPEKLVGGR